MLASPRVFREIDVSVLKRPVFAVYAAYFLVTLISISIAFALNSSAGWFDTFKTFATLVLMACISLVLVKTADWDLGFTPVTRSTR